MDQGTIVLGFLSRDESADLGRALHCPQMPRQPLGLTFQARDFVRPQTRRAAPAALARPSRQGAKNEALQIISAVLLTDEKVTVTNLPDMPAPALWIRGAAIQPNNE